MTVICIGYDSTAPEMFAVCRHSVRRHLPYAMRIIGINLATESPFLAPFKAGWGEGWAIYIDGNNLVLCNLAGLFGALDDRYAVMDGCGLFAVNMAHLANRGLTLPLIGTSVDLRAFPWLARQAIGTLPAEWRWSPQEASGASPSLVGFLASPPEPDEPFTREWRHEHELWISGDFNVPN